jgi:hypothetical protein
VPYYSSRTTFEKNQVIFYDTTMAAADGNCEFTVQYLTANGMSSSTAGEQDPTRTIAIQCLFDGAYNRGTASIVAGRAIKYTTDGPVTGIADPTAGARVPTRLGLTASPNPFRSAASARLNLPVAGRVRVAVYDVSGRVVRTLVDDEMQAGSHSLRWDGRDEGGRRVANGTYLFKAETGAGVVTAKTVQLR